MSKNKQAKYIGFYHSPWRGKFISSSAKWYWTKDSIQLLAVWFGIDLQSGKNWTEVANRVTTLTQPGLESYYP